MVDDTVRHHIHLLINGQKHQITGADAFLSLSDYLRLRHGLIGAKIVCSEGDCGACTVLVADLDTADAKLKYRTIDSCIAWMFQLDRTHVITVEGLGDSKALHPVQQAMIDCHGSQCGFCTPGFVMAMAGLAENAVDASGNLNEANIRSGLSGNLCRCTGYTQIINAAKSIDIQKMKLLNDRYPPAELHAAIDGDDNCIYVIDDIGRRELYIPVTLSQALHYLADHPDARIVSGATDLGVAVNKGIVDLKSIIWIGRIKQLHRVEHIDGHLNVGSAATWSQVLPRVESILPEFAKILEVFGAPQIRNAATIGGNIVNASPIADSLPMLFVLQAQLRLMSATGDRWVNIRDFYLGYKKLDLRPGELLVSIRIPIPTLMQQLRLYKISKRRDLDISTFTAAVALSLKDGVIDDAKLAFGGVGPTVLRLCKTEAFLQNKTLGESTMAQAGAIARREITPITDVRASAEYRLDLAESILMKAYFDIASETGETASV